MASSFLPLSSTTTTAICSSCNLLVASFTQHLASHPTSCSLLKTSSPLPSPLIKSPVCRLSSRIPQALILIILNSEIFYCRNGVLATNIINTASAPHQRCQHPTKGVLLLAPSNGPATFLAFLLIAVRRHLLTTSSRLPSQLLTRHLGESHHLLALGKSVYHSKCVQTNMVYIYPLTTM